MSNNYEYVVYLSGVVGVGEEHLTSPDEARIERIDVVQERSGMHSPWTHRVVLATGEDVEVTVSPVGGKTFDGEDSERTEWRTPIREEMSHSA